MTHPYSENYLSFFMNSFGVFLDYSCVELRLEPAEALNFFCLSGLALQIEHSNPRFLAGMSGIELAKEMIYRIKGYYPDEEYPLREGKTPYYWTGYAMSFYQWRSGIPFKDITNTIPANVVLNMYSKYHEMDLEHFVEEMDRLMHLAKYERLITLKLEREKAGLSQSALSKLSGVPLRTIQQYEQGQKDLNRAAAETVYSLSTALNVPIEVLIQHTGDREPSPVSNPSPTNQGGNDHAKHSQSEGGHCGSEP